MTQQELLQSNLLELLCTGWYLPRTVMDRGVMLFQSLGSQVQIEMGQFYEDNEQAPVIQTLGRKFDRRSENAEERLLARMGVQLTDNGTAIVPVFGILAKRLANIGLSQRGTSTDMLTDVAAILKSSDAVRQVVGNFDTPGGSVLGTEFAAQAFRDLAQTKPTTAVVNELMASGGWYLGSQFAQVVIAPGGYVGSMGVYTVRVEQIGNFKDQFGEFKVHVVASSREKVDGHPAVKFDDEEQARLQREVDTFLDMFISAVAEGRGIPREEAATLADGTVEIGAAAVERGFADKVASLADAVSESDGISAASRFSLTNLRAKAMRFKTKKGKDAPATLDVGTEVSTEEAAQEPDAQAERQAELDARAARLDAQAAAQEKQAVALAKQEQQQSEDTAETEAETFVAKVEVDENGMGRIVANQRDGIKNLLTYLHAEEVEIEANDAESGKLTMQSGFKVLCAYIEAQPAVIALDEKAPNQQAVTQGAVMSNDVQANMEMLRKVMAEQKFTDVSEAVAWLDRQES